MPELDSTAKKDTDRYRYRYAAMQLQSGTHLQRPVRAIYLSIFTGSLIYEHYTRECKFGNFDKIKTKNTKKTKQHKKTQKLLAEFLFK